MSHGHAKRGQHSDTYKSWRYMWGRVRYDSDYAHVAVCQRWKDFSAFLNDVGEKPVGKTLDRIDPMGNYEPTNCRWATPIEQANNTLANTRYTFGKKTLTLADWAREVGINYKTLHNRISACGWSISSALTTPVRASARYPTPAKLIIKDMS